MKYLMLLLLTSCGGEYIIKHEGEVKVTVNMQAFRDTCEELYPEGTPEEVQACMVKLFDLFTGLGVL